MPKHHILYFLLIIITILAASGMPISSQSSGQSGSQDLIVGRNVNMVSGTTWPGGDPYLQRQNEPSIAVSTRNPLHLLAGSNDYRTVDMPSSEGPLPGIPEGAAAGDAWLGVFKSFNGGQSWTSTLLPGYPQDVSWEGIHSPLFGLSAASDPTVRAGANGLFYYSGIAFDRIEHGRSVLFVARFIDNNFTRIGDTDPIKYLDATIIDEGTSGQFADKPWIAIDAPRYGTDTVPISAPNTDVQNVARHNVYVVYSIFLGSLGGGDQSKIMFARSTDCGRTWERPIKVSESQHINQGTTIAVNPEDGKIYIAWRRFASASEPHAIMMCKSEDFGLTFNKSVVVAPINPFDQFSENNRFRTYAFPTIAVDDNGIVYVAWSDRGLAQQGDARIVITTSEDGINWPSPVAVDNHGDGGHQIMPSLAFAAGKLMMTWYDTRKSEGGFEPDISDPGPTGMRHTMDVWVAQAEPSLNPTFADHKQVSKYLYWVETVNGEVPSEPKIQQMEFNPPNYPLFIGGEKPFFGDYIDITPAPSFLYDVQKGTWRFNTENSDPATYHISWTDNRDVRPPADGNWTLYNPPNIPSSTTPCTDGTRTGMRNQNIYTSHITRGIMIGSPANTKPLSEFRRSFLVFVKNLTEDDKLIRLAIEAPDGMQASFWEFGPPKPEECPFEVCGNQSVEFYIDQYSSITLTVFVQPFENPYATFRVKVEEIEKVDDLENIVFQDYIVLNPDPENTRIIPVLEEYHTPAVMIEPPADVNLTDPTVLSENIVYVPHLEEILNFANPDIVTPAFRSPAFRSGNIVNPAFRSEAVGDWPEGEVTDLQWRVTNNNDTTSAYSFLTIGEDDPLIEEGVAYQLLIYRVSTTPASDQCELYGEEHHELLLKIDSPAFRSPAFRSPAFRSPAFRSNTFSLAPGETAVCTLRLIEPGPVSGSGGTVQGSRTLNDGGQSNNFTPEDYAATVAAAAVPQAANPDGQIHVATSLYIISEELMASVNDPYEKALEAFGGTPYEIDDKGTEDPDDDIWKYTNWALKDGSFLPDGLSLDPNGNIYGTPTYNPSVTYPQTTSFIVELKDNSTPQQMARREFRITLNCQFHPIMVNAGLNGKICYSGAGGEECITGQGSVEVPHGESMTFTIHPTDACYHTENVTVVDNGGEEQLGPVDQYTFADVRSDNKKIEATFAINIYTITVTAGEGGRIEPSGESGRVSVECGKDQTFNIYTDEGYLLEDVIVDGESQGPKTAYTFSNVTSDHTMDARFKKLQEWERRYNNVSVNGNDEASDIAVDSAGNVYVTGYSIGRTTGPDYYTISYTSGGVQGLSARYDGPAHEGDYANAIVVDSSGNVYVTGYSYRGMPYKHSDYCTLKYDSTRKLVWNAQYDDRRNGNDVATAVAVDNSGFVYITGRSEDSLTKTDVKHYDYYTIKYNASTGRVEWGARYNGSVNGIDEATAIAVDAVGNVYVTGRSLGNGTGLDYITIKYAPTGGNPLWAARYNNINGNDEATAIAVDLLGNVYVTGKSQGNGTGLDYVTIKYDTIGIQKWVVRYNNALANGADEAAAIAVDPAGNVYVTGKSQGNGTGLDYVTIKYDTIGIQKWVVRYNNALANGADEAAAIAVDSAGNVYVTGKSWGNTTGFDYFTIKYGSSGDMVWRVRYNHSGGNDEATAVVVDAAGNVYVTGRSQGNGTGLDYATVKYKQK